ncbi:hypothetical protein FBQ82_23035 [Anaerolineae bacterium CFX7]|nr:hypothetical protein [Anaerolineae bacterium CFX7]
MDAQQSDAEAEAILNQDQTGVALEPAIAQPIAPPVPIAPPPPEPEPEPEEELSFAEALERFEQQTVVQEQTTTEEIVEPDDERTRKLKEDRRKRQTLVFDPKVGKVVAQKKHKGGKQDWLDELSQAEDETVDETSEAEEVEEE